MPTRWSDWVHVMCSTRGQWLPGDPRGFRNHDHRVHSSGDYKNPPPSGEHTPLNVYAKSIQRVEAALSAGERSFVCLAMAEKFRSMRIAVRAIAVCSTHAHALLHAGESDARTIFGRAKQHASVTLPRDQRGPIWGRSSHVVRIRDEGHYRNVAEYILRHRSQGGAVWEPETFADRGL